MSDGDGGTFVKELMDEEAPVWVPVAITTYSTPHPDRTQRGRAMLSPRVRDPRHTTTPDELLMPSRSCSNLIHYSSAFYLPLSVATCTPE